MYVLQYYTAEWEPAFLRQAREFPFFPLLPREASKSVPIFLRGTEANLKMVPIWPVPISRYSTVATYKDLGEGRRESKEGQGDNVH